MDRTIKIIIAVILAAAAGLFIYKQFSGPSKVVSDYRKLEDMKISIVAPAQISATDLTDEQKDKYLKQLKDQQDVVVKNNFDHLQSVNSVAQLKKLLGDVDGAITAWEYANIIRPLNSLSFSNLAALYHYDLKQYDKAEENYIISINNDPDDVNTIRNLFELYYYSLKDNNKAEGLLLVSIEANPEAGDLYALAGSFYAETGNLGKGIEFYEKALQLSPDNDAVRKEIERLQGAS